MRTQSALLAALAIFQPVGDSQERFPKWEVAPIGLVGTLESADDVVVGDVSNIQALGSQKISDSDRPRPVASTINEIFWCQADFHADSVVKGRIPTPGKKLIWAAIRPDQLLPRSRDPAFDHRVGVKVRLAPENLVNRGSDRPRTIAIADLLRSEGLDVAHVTDDNIIGAFPRTHETDRRHLPFGEALLRVADGLKYGKSGQQRHRQPNQGLCLHDQFGSPNHGNPIEPCALQIPAQSRIFIGLPWLSGRHLARTSAFRRLSASMLKSSPSCSPDI